MMISAFVVIILQLLVSTFYYFTFPGALSACMNICLKFRLFYNNKNFLQLLSKKIEECFISQFTPIFWSTVLLDLLMNNMSRDNQILPECISLSMVLKPKKSAQYLQKNTARNALSQRILSTPQMTTTVTKYY